MPRTSPNQKTVHINRDMPDKDKKEGNFLLVKQENWYAANKDLGPYGLQLYLYIAGNKDGFDLALSQEAAEEEAGIKKTTFHNYVNIMIEKGYLVQRNPGSSIFEFYEIPKKKDDKKAVPSGELKVSPREPKSSSDKQNSSQGSLTSSQRNKEIYNIDIINNIKKTVEDCNVDGTFVF